MPGRQATKVLEDPQEQDQKAPMESQGLQRN